MTGRAASIDERSGRRGLAVCLAAGALLVLGLSLSIRGVEPFRTWSYQATWFPLLLLADGALAAATGRFALLDRPRYAVSLFAWSVPTWFFFELLNLRVAAWFYVNVPPELAVRWSGYALAFGTVLPAVFLPYEWLRRWGLASGWRGPTFRLSTGVLRSLAVAGVACLVLPLWRPALFHPLMWAGAALLLAPWNHRRSPDDSLLEDVSSGRYARPVRLLAGGLVAGLAWESLNSVAGAYWIYTVPGLESGKLFEMPVPGFVGFAPFALECFVVYRSLVLAGVAVPGWNGGGGGDGERVEDHAEVAGVPEGSGPSEVAGVPRIASPAARVLGAAALALTFVAGVAHGMDRWTVDSYRSGLGELPGVGAAEARALERSSRSTVEALARADSVRVAQSTGIGLPEAGTMVRAARLSHLRGLGAPAAAVLMRNGVTSVCDLADAGVARVAGLLGDEAELGPRRGRPARVRVRIREARERCPPREGS